MLRAVSTYVLSRDGNRLLTARWNLTAKYVRTVLQIKRGGWQREKELVHRCSHEISSHSMSQHHIVWALDIRYPRAGVLYHISTGGLRSHWQFITYMRRIRMHSMPLHIDCLYGGFLLTDRDERCVVSQPLSVIHFYRSTKGVLMFSLYLSRVRILYSLGECVISLYILFYHGCCYCLVWQKRMRHVVHFRVSHQAHFDEFVSRKKRFLLYSGIMLPTLNKLLATHN